MTEAHLKSLIRDVHDFPKPGIVFKDITPLLANEEAFRSAAKSLADPFRSAGITQVVGIEARGFIFAAPVAADLCAGFVPVRKPGKLPHDIKSLVYDLEYGTDTLEVHADALTTQDVVLVVDDVLATGGTAAATIELIEGMGAKVAGLAVLVELDFLNGRSRLDGVELVSLVRYGAG